jgi:GTP-sensing pleiotropic transcriptional regulator CodY
MENKGVFEIVRDSGKEGLTIAKIVSMTRLPKSVVCILLARLESAEKIGFRNVGMSKVYFTYF